MQNFKTVRVFFSKTDECRFVGHLDVSRIVTRAIVKSKLPIWRTEGFNVHPYITFSNPLSLGFTSYCESFDIRLVDDDFDISTIPELLNSNLPNGLKILSASLPKYKNTDIINAKYLVKLTSNDISSEELYFKLKTLLESDEIIVEKKTKKGFKEVDLSKELSVYNIELIDEEVSLDITLPSGNSKSINPILFIDKLMSDNNIEVFYNITREKMLVENGEEFR